MTKRNKQKDSENGKRWYKANKEHKLKECKRWRDTHKERYDELRFKWRLKQYGTTPEEVEAAKINQKGLCAICNQEKNLYIDHCHDLKKFRGLLCNECNLVLGFADDNISILKSAILYLQQHAI